MLLQHPLVEGLVLGEIIRREESSLLQFAVQNANVERN